MNRNLYSPPTTVVADPVEPVRPRGARPRDVTWAANLIWVSLFIDAAEGVFIVAFNLFPQFELGIVGPAILMRPLLILVVRAAVTLWVTMSIRQGRNWARTVLTALVLVGTAYIATRWRTYLHLEEFQKPSVPYVAYQIIRPLVELAAVALLFTSRANPWFKAAH